MKKIILFTISLLIMITLCGCSNNATESNPEKKENQTEQKDNDKKQETENKDNENKKEDDSIVKLSFKDALSYKYLKTIANKKVSITGYMATSSPVDGSFIFLMNLPYQSCPFCKPNTSELSNTIEVYPKSSKTFDYTEMAITISGTLIVADDEKKPFTDSYGYEFNFKIVDATYKIVDESEISAEVSLWQEIASSSLINEIYEMLDYVNFTCMWPTYFVNSYEDADGNLVPGFYLWEEDAEHYLYTDDAQFNYGTKSNYFENLIKKAKKLDENKLSKLIEIINKANALSKEGEAALANKEFTYEVKYLEKFGTTDKVYTLNKAEYFEKAVDDLYNEFMDWFTSFLDDLEM